MNLPPRGLSREQAAAYCGISVSLLDAMVEQGRLPKPMRFNARVVWDRRRIDEALDRLSHGVDDDKDKVEFAL